MMELDIFGEYNTRYEGVANLVYLGQENVPVFFDARQLFDGRLIIACVSLTGEIKEEVVCIKGYLLSGEPFSTMWGRKLEEIYKNNQDVKKAYYIANMTRVRYTKDLQPDSHSVQFALHNFIPRNISNFWSEKISFKIKNCEFAISPVYDFNQQMERLRKYGGNLRTAWVKVLLKDEKGQSKIRIDEVRDIVLELLAPMSLALGTVITCPQMITFDKNGKRNDVEHYRSSGTLFSNFIRDLNWDISVQDAIEAWNSPTRIHHLTSTELAININQHLDACSTESYLESRALISATLLDVLAGTYYNKLSLNKNEPFRFKLKKLLDDLNIDANGGNSSIPLTQVIKERNSLVHSGDFASSTEEKNYSKYLHMTRLGRYILLHLIGVKNVLLEI